MGFILCWRTGMNGSVDGTEDTIEAHGTGFAIERPQRSE